MIRILQCVNDMHRAGLETMLMNYYRNIDKEKIQFDFLTHRPYRSDYDDEIENLGGRIYYAPRLYPQNYPKYFRWMKHFFYEHSEYKIVHSHIDAMSYLPLKAAKDANIPVRISHSHNTAIDKDFKYFLKQYFRFKIPSVATEYCACGQEAGKFLFGDRDFIFIPNAIEKDRFLYNKDIRTRKRKKLGISDEFVVGHVGRFSYQKNHEYLIEIFNQLLKIETNSLLLLVGVGEKEEKIKNLVHELGIESKVRFLGNRNDVNELYQAMDVLVMPSFFEGVPVVGIEAQFSDLPCVFSNKVPKEVKFNAKTQFVSLDATVDDWIMAIEKVKGVKRNTKSKDLENSQYDIKEASLILENYYLDIANREKL